MIIASLRKNKIGAILSMKKREVVDKLKGYKGLYWMIEFANPLSIDKAFLTYKRVMEVQDTLKDVPELGA